MCDANFTITTAAGQLYPTTLSNDLVIQHGGSNNQMVMGILGSSNLLIIGSSNVSVVGSLVGSNATFSSNLTANSITASNLSIGTVASSRITVGYGGAILGSTVSITQVVGSNITASNLSASNLTIGSNMLVDASMNLSNLGNVSASGSVTCSNISNRGRLLIYN